MKKEKLSLGGGIEKICICSHPESWHGEASEARDALICMGKYCPCKFFQASRVQYDSKKWVEMNDLKAISGGR